MPNDNNSSPLHGAVTRRWLANSSFNSSYEEPEPPTVDDNVESTQVEIDFDGVASVWVDQTPPPATINEFADLSIVDFVPNVVEEQEEHEEVVPSSAPPVAPASPDRSLPSQVGQEQILTEDVYYVGDVVQVSGYEEVTEKEPPLKPNRPILNAWLAFTHEWIRQPLLRLMIAFAKKAVTRPFLTMFCTISLAIGLLALGYFTGFDMETEGNTLWTPDGEVTRDSKWVGGAGFPSRSLAVNAILYRESGNNVLDLDGANRLFDITDVIKNTEGYAEICVYGEKDADCTISAASAFWLDNNRTLFEAQVTSDEDVAPAMSGLQFADEQPAIRDAIFGFPDPTCTPKFDVSVSQDLFCAEGEDNEILSSAKSYLIQAFMPWDGTYRYPYEKLVMDSLVELENTWNEQDDDVNDWRIVFISNRSIDDEMTRGIYKDIPLMFIAFVIMGTFCGITFFRCHPVKNHLTLGFGAITTILLSLMTSYGLLFLCRVPFTALTQAFPYVMFGIGLDDTFILTGSFYRKDPRLPAIVRIEQTMEEVGISIFVSTLTTVVAFSLGALATIPGIKWFSYYAAPTVFIDFIYQISFFLALVVVDDARIKANRYDIACCIKKKSDNGVNKAVRVVEDDTTFTRFFAMIVNRYGELLLKPVSKVLVLLGFFGLLAVASISASQQKQVFDYRELTPADSYIRDYTKVVDEYTSDESNVVMTAGVYFRDIDFSLPETREAMKDYVNDLVAMEYITNPPVSFWVTDFESFLDLAGDLLADATFEQQMDQFLGIDEIERIHGDNIVRNEDGTIAASRTYIFFDKVDLAEDIPQQIAALKEQRAVARRQPLNEGRGQDLAMFASAHFMPVWVTFSVIVNEILLTVVAGLVSVFVIGLIFLPSPYTAFLVAGVVAMIYVDLMGVLRWAGIYLNPVSSVGLTSSIGLVVDYNLHVVMAYFEIPSATDRNDRVKQTLNTMGRSIMLGALSTFLGVVPLAFVSTLSFTTFFYTFLGIVTLGAGHGLIFTPVVLSLIGPKVADRSDNDSDKRGSNNTQDDLSEGDSVQSADYSAGAEISGMASC